MPNKTTEPQKNNEIQLNKKLNKKPNKLCKVVRWFVGIVLILALAYAIIGFNSYVIVTNSMKPIIDGITVVDDEYVTGDTVIINKFASVDNLKQYDIIAFYADIDDEGEDPESEIVVHYVYSIEEIDGKTVIRTVRHNIDEDEGITVFDLTDEEILEELDTFSSGTVYEEDYIGKLVTVIKNDTIGSLLLFSSSTIGRIVLVVDIIVIYLIIELFSSSKTSKDKELDAIKQDASSIKIDNTEE